MFVEILNLSQLINELKRLESGWLTRILPWTPRVLGCVKLKSLTIYIPQHLLHPLSDPPSETSTFSLSPSASPLVLLLAAFNDVLFVNRHPLRQLLQPPPPLSFVYSPINLISSITTNVVGGRESELREGECTTCKIECLSSSHTFRMPKKKKNPFWLLNHCPRLTTDMHYAVTLRSSMNFVFYNSLV